MRGGARVTVITLAVADLDRAPHFYRDGLELQSEGIIAQEFQRDERHRARAMARLHLEPGVSLSLYSRAELAHDAKVPLAPATSAEFGVGQLMESRDAVDATLALAEAVRATITEPPHDRPFGIYSGYVTDPDGHL